MLKGSMSKGMCGKGLGLATTTTPKHHTKAPCHKRSSVLLTQLRLHVCGHQAPPATSNVGQVALQVGSGLVAGWGTNQ